MKFQKIIFLILFILLILLVGDFLSKKTCISHPDIRVNTVKSGDLITSPLIIEGEARGTWYFEADFPVFLLNESGAQIAFAIARAQHDWMTEDFVPFKTELKFDVPKKMNGTLVFKKDNPSDLPEYDDELRVPVIISNK